MAMKRYAFLFPGQGSQTVGMGRDLYEAFPSAKMRYDEAGEILQFPLKEYSFAGPAETLTQTYVTQPALFVHSVVLTELLGQRGIMPCTAAGHSLGEYSALAAAGAAAFADLLNVVRVRGALMQTAGEKAPGTMAALIGADSAAAEAICRRAGAAGVVNPANFNAPGQIVISGSVAGVHEAMNIAKEFGVKRAVELNVGGAFHSPLMAGATEGLVNKIDDTPWNATKIPVVANVTAENMSEPGEIRENLKKQLLHPVLWSDSVMRMAQDGIDAFIEVGAGRVLQGLAKRIQREVPCHAVGTVEDLESIMNML